MDLPARGSRLLCVCLAAAMLSGCVSTDDVTTIELVTNTVAPITATPVPTPTATATPTPTPEPTPTPHPALLFAPSALEETDPGNPAYKYIGDVQDNGEVVEEYRRPDAISMGLPEEYTALEGITTFRGNNFRDAASYGTVDIVEAELSKEWSISIGGIDKWTGVGWNGQPSIVRWSEEQRNVMNMYPEKKRKDGLVEVIYASLDGKIRFMDLEDGSPTRDPINVGSPIKGSVTVDPRGYPLLYVGQGISYGEKMGYRVFSLIDHSVLLFINGSDRFNHRGWRAFDSNALIDAKTDTLIICGENGILYTVKLNTDFDPLAATIAIDPHITKYRYKSALSPTVGTESSPCVFGGYLFYTDNSGLVQCLDINTLTPVWVRHCTDDTDSTPVLHLQDDGLLALYTACEVDKQGPGGSSYIRKLDGATGELLWEHSYVCGFDSDVNGGALATPVIGQNDLEGSVIFLIAKTKTGDGRGTLVCFDQASGEIIWEKAMKAYGWSSPVGVYTPDGKGYLIVCDANGEMYLIDGASGETLSTTSLKANIEGSPVVFEDMVVVGTRGNAIYGVKIQ